MEEAEEEVDVSGMSLTSLSFDSFNLAAITKLDISNNNLDSIPESLAARMVNIEVLDAHSNQLRSLPNSIGCLARMKILNVSGNLLQSLPKTIEDCRSLEELNANFNKLIRLPETMGFELLNLRKLSVNSNKLDILPYSTSHMTSLRVLDARLNCLRSLPDGIENLIRLEILNVSQNFHYLKSLPYSIGLLVSLNELDISYNSISVLPDSIANLSKLRKLEATGNPLVCPPIEVMERSIDAVRDFLNSRMKGSAPPPPMKKGSSWLGKLVKHGTFQGRIRNNRSYIDENQDGLLLSHHDYRSIDGLATPRYAGRFSPLRIFSPKRR